MKRMEGGELKGEIIKISVYVEGKVRGDAGLMELKCPCSWGWGIGFHMFIHALV